MSTFLQLLSYNYFDIAHGPGKAILWVWKNGKIVTETVNKGNKETHNSRFEGSDFEYWGRVDTKTKIGSFSLNLLHKGGIEKNKSEVTRVVDSLLETFPGVKFEVFVGMKSRPLQEFYEKLVASSIISTKGLIKQSSNKSNQTSDYLLVFRGVNKLGLKSFLPTIGVYGRGIYFYTKPEDAAAYAGLGGGIIIAKVKKVSAKIHNSIVVVTDPSKIERVGFIPTENTLDLQYLPTLVHKILLTSMESREVPITIKVAQKIGNKLKVDWGKVNLEQFRRGLEVEQEHKDVTGDNLLLTGKIALAHLKELPDYYTRLDKMEKGAKLTSSKPQNYTDIAHKGKVILWAYNSKTHNLDFLHTDKAEEKDENDEYKISHFDSFPDALIAGRVKGKVGSFRVTFGINLDTIKTNMLKRAIRLVKQHFPGTKFWVFMSCVKATTLDELEEELFGGDIESYFKEVTRVEKVEFCPVCNTEIREKSTYLKDGSWYHSPCGGMIIDRKSSPSTTSFSQLFCSLDI